jgi:hypothetical protein
MCWTIMSSSSKICSFKEPSTQTNPSPALLSALPPPTAASGSTTRTCECIHAKTGHFTCSCEIQASKYYEDRYSRWLEIFHSVEGSRHTPRLNQHSSSRQSDFAQDTGGSAAIGRRGAVSELADVGCDLPVAAHRTKHSSKKWSPRILIKKSIQYLFGQLWCGILV